MMAFGKEFFNVISLNILDFCFFDFFLQLISFSFDGEDISEHSR